jgi:hypothetical protein
MQAASLEVANKSSSIQKASSFNKNYSIANSLMKEASESISGGQGSVGHQEQ